MKSARWRKEDVRDDVVKKRRRRKKKAGGGGSDPSGGVLLAGLLLGACEWPRALPAQGAMNYGACRDFADKPWPPPHCAGRWCASRDWENGWCGPCGCVAITHRILAIESGEKCRMG